VVVEGDYIAVKADEFGGNPSGDARYEVLDEGGGNLLTTVLRQ
jgi:hypothetical protein